MPKLGKFSASAIHRLLADGIVDWKPEREGAKGCYHYLDYPGKVFERAADYADFIKSERKRLSINTLSVGAMTYAEEKAVELLAKEDPEFEPEARSVHLNRGNEREAEAVALFAMEYNLDITATGENQQFIDCGEWGATPDGITADSTVEGKAPTRLNHQSNIIRVSDYESLKKEHPVYAAQVQAQIAATGFDYGWWFSYNPKFHNVSARLHAVRIDRHQEDIDYMLLKIKIAAEYRDCIVDRIMGL